MSTFAEILQKADLALSDLTSSGGLLLPEQQDTFFRKVIDAPTILNQVRYVQMKGPKLEINKVGFGSRIARAANQGTISSPRSGEEGTRALARADRIKPDLSKITLESDEIIAEINLPYETLEDNIEGDRFQETLMTMIAQALARDFEEKLILGDAASADSYLALSDGLLVEATSNIVNHGGATISVDLFENMVNALPVRYHNFLDQMRFFTSKTREVNYRAQVAKRQTQLGDQALTSSNPVDVLGVPLKGASQMPNSNALLVAPKNILWGMQRDVRIETARDIRERVIIVVITARIAHKYEEEDMVVKATNIG